MKKFLAAAFMVIISIPSQAQAALLTCTEGDQCDFCELIHTLDNIILWVVSVAILIAVIGLMYSGFRMSSSRGNVSTFTDAKDMLVNIIIGLFIIMAAWMIVDTILKTVVGGDFGVWNDPQECGSGMFSAGVALEAGPLNESEVSVVSSYYSPTGTSNITAYAGNLTSYAGHQFDSSIISQVNYIARTFDLRVSGGYRTAERNAEVGGVANSHHLTGRAADFVGTSERMQAAASWARQNGALEVLIHDAGSGSHLHVAW